MGVGGGGGGRQSPRSTLHSEKTKKPGLPKGQSQGPSASTGAFPEGMRVSCTQSGSWFRVLGPISGGLAHPGPPGGWERACPPEQPRALTALAAGILQGFTPSSNQGTHGGQDSMCVPSFQHRDRALCVSALSEPDDQETCLEVVTSVLGLRNLGDFSSGGRRVREQGPLWVCVSKVSEGDWSARWKLACTPTSQSLERHGSIASNTFGQSLS